MMLKPTRTPNAALHRLPRLAASVAVMAALCGSLLAALQREPAVSIEAAADRLTATVGDRIAFTVRVRHAPDDQVQWPSPEEKLGPFHVLGFELPDPQPDQGAVVSTAVYSLAAFELGELEIPEVQVNFLQSGQSESRVLQSEPVKIQLESVVEASQQPAESDPAGAGQPAGEIRDIRGVRGIPLDWRIVAAWVAAGLAAAGLAFWLYRRWRRRPKSDAAPEAVLAAPIRPPHEVAYEALEQLESSPLLEQGRIKEYYIRVSEIIREYVEGRFGIEAMEMTSREVVGHLRKKRIEQRELESFEDFFSRSDLVKFAKVRPRGQSNRMIVPAARSIVDATKKVEQPEIAAAPGAAALEAERRDGATVPS